MTDFVLRSQVALLLALTTPPRPSRGVRARGAGDRGQTTAEYGLVLLGAAGIALLLVGWATKSGAVGKLFDVVMDNVIGKVQ